MPATPPTTFLHEGRPPHIRSYSPRARWADVRVEKEDLLAAATVPALLRAGEVEQFPRHLLLRSEYDTVFCEDAEHRARMRDRLHGIFD